MNKKNKKPKNKLGLTFVSQKQIKKLPLYHISWRDHAVSGSNNKWDTFTSVDVKIVTCYSVGFQVAENEEAIALAQNVTEAGGVGEIVSILKNCIIKKTKL